MNTIDLVELCLLAEKAQIDDIADDDLKMQCINRWNEEYARLKKARREK